MRLTQLNFISSPPSLYGWRGVLFAAGLLALLGAGADWYFRQKSIANVEMQLSKARSPAPARPVLSAARRRELDEQAKAVRVAVRQLNAPFGALIKSLQPPKDIRVALLGLDLVAGGGKAEEPAGSGASGALKVMAEARTPQEMATYTAFLSDQAIFQSVYLVKHELYATSAERPYRFLLEAQWQE